MPRLPKVQPPCVKVGCRRLFHARGLCKVHYNELRAKANPLRCEQPNCGKPMQARKMCAMHYRRFRLYGDPSHVEQNRWHDGRCSVDGCAAPYSARGWCVFHYTRWHDTGDPLTPPRPPYRFVAKDGYVHIRRPGHPNANTGGDILEHRWLVAEALGRPLRPGETVHHRNGRRSDNRLENLELWVKHQPYGQRVCDLLAWARNILALYEAEESSPVVSSGVTPALAE